MTSRFNNVADQRKRRTMFDSFVRTRADDLRKEKRGQINESRDAFRALLEEMEATTPFTASTTTSQLEADYASDARSVVSLRRPVRCLDTHAS